MTNEMKLQNGVLTMGALDEVSGGTVSELEDLTRDHLIRMFREQTESLPIKLKVFSKKI